MMRPLESYGESLDFIYGLRSSRIELGLERVIQALQLFGNPQHSFPAFHVAGTNGKGSTAAMLHRILCAGGYRTGLYISPHLSSFTERIRVGDALIAEDEVVSLIHEIRQRTHAAGIALTFFEFATVMAFLHFARQRIDVAVVEVGLGGRLDATSVVHPIVSMITSIAIDHEAFLGSDVRSIAREKAGIIRERIPVVCGPLPEEAMVAVECIARERGAPVSQWQRDFSLTGDGHGRLSYKGSSWRLEGLELHLRGLHQQRNAAVAIAALELARPRFPVGEDALRQGLRNAEWPGRLEVFWRRPIIILDGAHNIEGTRTLVSEVPSIAGKRKVRLLFGSMSDKNWRSMLCLLSEVSDDVVLTQVPRPQGVPPDALREALPSRARARVIADPVAALQSLIADAEKAHVPILVAGSLYLIGHVRGHVVSGTV